MSVCFISLQVLGSSSQIFAKKSYRNYQVLIEWDDNLDGERVTIKKDRKIIYSEEELGSHFWIGNHFDESLNDKDPHSGRDITGNGIPDLILTKWNGGAHCCNFLTVFEMGKSELKKIITIDGGSNGFEVQDLDNDQIPEIIFWDWPIDYLFNSFSDSAQARVVLKYIDGQYHVASSLMYKRRPNNMKLIKVNREIIKSFTGMGDRVPYELLKIMMELSYTGYKELAFRIADETWPKERTDLNKFKRKFKEALANSIYWSEFNTDKY